MAPGWHEKEIEDICTELGTGKKGIFSEDVTQRMEKYGKNVIPEKKKQTDLELFIEQFKNILVIILIAASAVSVFLGEVLDAAAIVAIVILNSLFGFFQEKKAEKTLDALKKFSAQRSKVMRDGEVTVIDAADIVPGDVLVLEVGDKIPADARIIELSNLKADESVLTGESTPVIKEIATLRGNLAVADRKNMLFSGTTIVYGRCTALVVETGQGTEFGKIAVAVQGKDDTTPLHEKLEVLGRQLSILILVICIIVFVAGALHGLQLMDVFLTAVSLAVAAIPEGLPAVVTITLAIGLMRMARKNAIMRKLTAAETLGSTTFICTDKTGTLTKNEMTVRKVFVSGRTYDVTGEGYDSEGEFLLSGKRVEHDEDLAAVLIAGMMCNNAKIGKEQQTNTSEMHSAFIGDPTEIALIVSAQKHGVTDIRESEKRTAEIEFDSTRKMMSVCYEIDNRHVMYTKGAVEEVLKRSKSVYKNGTIHVMTTADRRQVLEANETFAKSALRVLAFATKKLKHGQEAEEDELIFMGLQGMMDPPRSEARESIEKCKQAGIRVVMITGDHRDTAVAVGTELGMLNSGEKILTGVEMDAMNDVDLENIAESVSIYARVSPEHKVRITQALKNRGHIVAMTGDGVNDAPALKKADIGIAMGLSGTDVAKEASDMVLTDDNFSSIVSAVEEGRGIYNNIKKFINYLLSCNIAEVIVVFFALLFIRDPVTGAFFLPMIPIQLLWMNLVTDGLPAIALGTEPYDSDIMKRKPRDPKENVLDRGSLEFIIVIGLIISAITLYLFYNELPDEVRARTMAFTALVMFEMAVALSFRSPEYFGIRKIRENKLLWISIAASVLLQIIIVQMPVFNPIFGTEPLIFDDWVRIFVAAFAVFLAIEAEKAVKVRRIFSVFRKKQP